MRNNAKWRTEASGNRKSALVVAEFRDVVAVEVKEASDVDIIMMFDPGHSLAERILREQFDY